MRKRYNKTCIKYDWVNYYLSSVPKIEGVVDR